MIVDSTGCYPVSSFFIGGMERVSLHMHALIIYPRGAVHYNLSTDKDLIRPASCKAIVWCDTVAVLINSIVPAGTFMQLSISSTDR